MQEGHAKIMMVARHCRDSAHQNAIGHAGQDFFPGQDDIQSKHLARNALLMLVKAVSHICTVQGSRAFGL